MSRKETWVNRKICRCSFFLKPIELHLTKLRDKNGNRQKKKNMGKRQSPESRCKLHFD